MTLARASNAFFDLWTFNELMMHGELWRSKPKNACLFFYLGIVTSCQCLVYPVMKRKCFCVLRTVGTNRFDNQCAFMKARHMMIHISIFVRKNCLTYFSNWNRTSRTWLYFLRVSSNVCIACLHVVPEEIEFLNDMNNVKNRLESKYRISKR